MDKSKYPATIAALWKTKSGKQYRSMPIDARLFDDLQKLLSSVAIGGRLIFKEVPEEQRKTDKSPQGYFEYQTPEQVADEKQRLAGPQNTGGF